MKDRKLTQLIMLLNKQECDDLGLFVRSPYFNKQENLITLLDYFLKYWPKYDKEEFSQEDAWAQISPNSPFDKGRFAQLMTKLYKLIEQFIHTEAHKGNVLEAHRSKSNYFINKKSIYFFEKHYKEFKKTFSKHIPKKADDFQILYQIELDYHNFANNISSLDKMETIFTSLNQALDQYIIIEKLRIGTLVLNHQTRTNEHLHTPFASEVFQYAKDKIDGLPPLAALWYFVYLLLTDQRNEESYSELKQFWLMNHEGFTSDTNVFVTKVLELSVLKAFGNNRKRYIEELFSLYLMSIQHKWILKEGPIQHIRFNNIVFVALFLNKIDWAKNFIVDFQQYLIPDFIEDVHSYNMARVDFAITDYSSCLKRIVNIDFVDTQMAVGTKRMQLKCYYEIDENGLMEAGINALRVYMHRIKGVSNFYKDHHHLFINVINQLFKVKAGDKGKDTLAKIKEEVDNKRSIPEYNWLVEKIADLEA
ncbi:MAG: hypothetical protein AB8F95_07715 [Bacteroidia bacterium]